MVELRTLVTTDSRWDGLRLAEHASPAVREEAATTIGRLKLEGTSQLLIKLSKDKVLDVRVAAFTAMGHHPDRAFLPVFLKCMENVRRGNPLERASVAWAANQMTPASPEEYETKFAALAHRIYMHCTRPVIPTEEGEIVFDDLTVVVNGMHTLVRWAKTTKIEELVGFARTTIGLYNLSMEEVMERNKNNPDMGDGMPNDQLTQSIAAQLLQYLEDKPLTPLQIDFDHPIFPVTPVGQEEQN